MSGRLRPELSVELIKEIAGLVAEGHYPKTVAIHSGVSVHQFNRWWDEGRELNAQFESGVEADGRVFTRDESLLMAFADEIDLAYAAAEIMHLNWVKELAAAGKSTWTAPMTWLERTRPGWQRRESLGDGQKSTDEELVELSRRFEAFDKKQGRV